MDELEIRSRVKFLKIKGVLPAFANIEEFSKIENILYDARFQKKKIGLVGESIFVYTALSPIASSKFDARRRKLNLLLICLKVISTILGENHFEKMGKRIWMSKISSLPESSRVRVLFLKLAQQSKEIEFQLNSSTKNNRKKKIIRFSLLRIIKKAFGERYSD